MNTMPVKKIEHANKYLTFDRKQKRNWKHTPEKKTPLHCTYLVIKSLQLKISVNNCSRSDSLRN